MKISFNPTTKVQVIIPGDNDRIVQNSSGNKVYLYGIEAGWEVKATFTRRDGFQIGLIGGIYDLDPDDEYCYIIPIPEKATEVDKGLGLSILIYEPSGTTFIRHSIIATSMYVYTSNNVIVPEDLDIVLYDAVMLAISNLTVNKLEHSAIVGGASETVDKDTKIYSKLKTDETFETIADADAHKNRVDNPHSVTKDQVGLGHANNTADINKPVSIAQQAALDDKVNLAGGNIFQGNQVIDGSINAVGIVVNNASIISRLYKNNTKIVNLGNGYDPGDAVNKGQLDSSINTHDINALAHEPIRLLIQDLDREISRLDGRGVSYGEVPYTTAELQAMNSITLHNAIIAAVEAKSWFEGTYTPSNGDLVYDEGVGVGVNYHEWEYNQDAGAWADNGAISSPKATNDIFGNVKGNSYVSIVAGLMQILLADNATYLKDESSANKYTYQQIYDAIANRYTKDEVNALLDSLKAIYGWEINDLTIGSPLTNGGTLSLSSIINYDKLLFVARETATDNIYTHSVPAKELTLGTIIKFDNEASVIVNIVVGSTNIVFNDVSNVETLKVYGVKMDGTVHNEMRSIGAETITYRADGKVSQVVGDNGTTTPTYDAYGNLIKITEAYYLDGKTYETTFTRDILGRIVTTNKVEV